MNKNITKKLIPDWIELYVLLNGFISKDDILGEFDYLDQEQVDDFFLILNKRLFFYGFKPYLISNGIIKSNFDSDSIQKTSYIFTLILGIYGNKFETNIAGKLFERLSNEIFISYLGGKSFVFGFPDGSGVKIEDKITEVSKNINENRGNQNPLSSAKDDKLDLISIKEIDNRKNKIIILSQCAAGHDWSSKLTQLSVNKWNQYINFGISPIRGFACPTFIDDEQIFYNKGLDGGLIFDRARIFRLLNEIKKFQDNLLENEILNWIFKAKKEYDLI